MGFPVVNMLLAAQLAIPAADNVPNVSYEPGCRAAAAANAALGVTVDPQSVASCMAEEKRAYDQLVQEWTQFAAGDREHCAREAALGQMPSYVELQICLKIARETKTLPKLESFIRTTPSKGR